MMGTTTPPPPQPQASGDTGPIDIGQVTVPITKTVVFVIGVLTVVLGLAATYWGLQAHSANRHEHLDQMKAVEGGGVAYKADVEKAKFEWRQALSDESRRTRKLIRKMEVNCKKTGNGFSCTTSLPEED
ncbi:MAG: hypothetical protein ACRD1Z_09370 [Vicinamibacteria bacterium]